MNPTEETIAAIVTASGEAGISVVRLSGPRALEIADALLRCNGDKPSKRKGGTFVHGLVLQGEEVIDETLLLVMRAPHSYTREDVIEIQGHGGPVCTRRILRRVIDEGARLAEPGEFTRRAFLNGRIDLLQAEAVLDLIKARSDRAAAAAVEQLEGGLSRDFNQLYEELLHVAADIEATLDFPEDELPSHVMDQLRHRLEETQGHFGRLIDTWDEGHLLRDGALIVISGKPNVGKSTLLNTLLDTDRAIVSSTPGTTRDSIEEGFVVGGFPARLVDTAGLRDVSCGVEREGIERAQAYMERADLHLYVVDGSVPLDGKDRNRIDALDPDHSVVLLNKVDLGRIVQPEDFAGHTVVSVSLTERQGLEEMSRALAVKFESYAAHGQRPHAVISERHRRLLVEGMSDLDSAMEMLQSGQDDMPALASSRLRDALEHIGTATGRVYQEDLLDSIFSRFCIGK